MTSHVAFALGIMSMRSAVIILTTSLFIFRCVQNVPFFKQANNGDEDSDLPLSEEGKNLVKDAQRRIPKTIFKSEFQQLNLQCNNKASKYLATEFPHSEVRWKLNGENFVMESSRMTYKLNSIYIQSLSTKDSGIFTCQIDVRKTRHYVVSVYVIVVGRVHVHVLPGDSVKLDCNSKAMGRLHHSATRYWQRDTRDVVGSRDVDGSRDKAVNPYLIISDVGVKEEGNWTCTVSDETLGETWVTARCRLSLAPVPPIMTKVRIYVKQNRVRSCVMLMTFAFLVVLLMNLIMKVLERKERAKKKEIEEMKKMLGIDTRDSLTRLTESVPLMKSELNND